MIITEKGLGGWNKKFKQKITCTNCLCAFETDTFDDVDRALMHYKDPLFEIICPICKRTNTVIVDEKTYKDYFAVKWQTRNDKRLTKDISKWLLCTVVLVILVAHSTYYFVTIDAHNIANWFR